MNGTHPPRLYAALVWVDEGTGVLQTSLLEFTWDGADYVSAAFPNAIPHAGWYKLLPADQPTPVSDLPEFDNLTIKLLWTFETNEARIAFFCGLQTMAQAAKTVLSMGRLFPSQATNFHQN